MDLNNALRDAIRWLSDRGEYSTSAIEEACVRFDLSPADQQFLFVHFKDADRSMEDK